jgi:hypothetical protein
MADVPLQIAVVMDPIDHIKPAKDTTLAMMLATALRTVAPTRSRCATTRPTGTRSVSPPA